MLTEWMHIQKNHTMVITAIIYSLYTHTHIKKKKRRRKEPREKERQRERKKIKYDEKRKKVTNAPHISMVQILFCS